MNENQQDQKNKTKESKSENSDRLREIFDLHTILRVHNFNHVLGFHYVCECGAVENYHNTGVTIMPARGVQIHFSREQISKFTKKDIEIYTKIKRIYGVYLYGNFP
jgi:pterin-4a-carbinolamine dehydratase